MPDSVKLALAAVLAAELGDGIEEAFQVLEAALKRDPDDIILRYDAACAFALASRAVASKQESRAKRWRLVRSAC